MKGAKAGDESGEEGRGEVVEGLECQVLSLLCSPKSLHNYSSSRAYGLTAAPASLTVSVAP